MHKLRNDLREIGVSISTRQEENSIKREQKGRSSHYGVELTFDARLLHDPDVDADGARINAGSLVDLAAKACLPCS